MGGGAAQPTTTTVNQQSLPEYAQPFYTDLMQRSQALSNEPYTPYQGQRIAEFTPEQLAVQNTAANLQTPQQFQAGSQMAAAAGLGSLTAAQYNPGTFSAQQVSANTYSAPGMGAAQTGYNPNLTNYQMDTPQTFGQSQADAYMSPYIRNVLDVQKSEAVRNAQKGQLTQNLDAARRGTYGGSRQLLAGMERERNLGDELSQIDAMGLQSAYSNAQQQFNADRTAGMSADQANLQANLGVQQLGTQTGLQTSLANLSAEQQANVQNLASQLQTQGLNAQQAMQAALANQQANMQAQQMGEQSRQFGSNLGLQGLDQALRSGQTLGNLGQMQTQSDLAVLNAQGQYAGQQQTQNQSILDQQYADFLRQRDYPLEQLGYSSNILRGLPIGLSSTTTSYAPPPSLGAQVGGLGLGALGLSNLSRGP